MAEPVEFADKVEEGAVVPQPSTVDPRINAVGRAGAAARKGIVRTARPI